MDIDVSALKALVREKDLSLEVVVETIEQALLVAYHHTEGCTPKARVVLDRKTGHVTVWAAETDDDGAITREWDDTPAGFGRIAATTARQVLLSRLREAEGDVTLSEFTAPSVTVSRSHPTLVKALFALEVPEIADGTVEIKGMAREAGHRTKIAVYSSVPGVNAKGACIGPLGQRVRQIMAELNGEKIDIVDWSEDPAEMIAHALSPARVTSVTVVDPVARAARVLVPDYQLSLAIGREGQNARLAARMTGWRIDIRPDSGPGGPDSPPPAAA